MKRIVVFLSVSLMFAGCQDQILEPELQPMDSAPGERHLLTAANLVPSYSCTRWWAIAADGDWNDAASWKPWGVPIPGDNVCIDAEGSYTVTIDADVETRIVQVGGANASPTLVVEHNLWVLEGIVVEAGARFEVEGAQTVHVGSSSPIQGIVRPDAGWFENRGIVEIADDCGCAPVTQWHFENILNDGWMNVDGAAVFGILGDAQNKDGHEFHNQGVLLTSGNDTIDVTGVTWAGAFRQSAGTIGGSAPVRVDRFDDFYWEGGTLPTNTANGGKPLTVLAWVAALHLTHTGLSGAVEARTVYDVWGDVGSDVRVRFVYDVERSNFVLLHTTGSQWTNSGHIEFARSPGTNQDSFPVSWDNNTPSPVPGIHRGSLSMEGDSRVVMGTWLWDTHFTNEGTISIDENSALVFGSGSATTHSLTNRGEITADHSSELEVDGGVFTATSSGSMTGRLVLDGGTLRGRGPVGEVVSAGGIVSPGVTTSGFLGSQLRFGTLRMESLFLDAVSRVFVQVEGTQAGDYDRIVVDGAVHYSGELKVQTLPPFLGGRCGQVIPVLADNTHGTKTTVPRGSFDTFTGMNVGPGRAWRLHNPNGLLALAGYQPGPELLYPTRTSFSLAEGGTQRQYRVCLGDPVPSADVTLTPTSQQGDALVSSPFVITPDNYALPRSLTVQAIDDAFVEGPHTDAIEHRLNSADKRFNDPTAGLVRLAITDNDGEADLAALRISQEDGQSVGDTMNTVFRITNAGPTESSGSTLVSTPLVGLRYVSAVGASCSDDGTGVVTCEIDEVPAGGQLDFTIMFEGLVVGQHGSTWTVTGEQPDPDGTNDAVDYTQRVN